MSAYLRNVGTLDHGDNDAGSFVAAAAFVSSAVVVFAPPLGVRLLAETWGERAVGVLRVAPMTKWAIRSAEND